MARYDNCSKEDLAWKCRELERKVEELESENKRLYDDREQYDKGYADGVRKFAEKVKPILRAMFDLMMDDNEIKCIIPNCKHPSSIPYMNKYCIKKNLAAWENKIDKLAGELAGDVLTITM